MKASWRLGLLLLAAASGPALADRHTAGRPENINAAEFLNLCQANVPATRAACGGLLNSYIDVYVLLGSKDPKMRVICPPRHLSIDQARFVFNGWAEKRKDLTDLDVAAAINRALLDSFPCGKAPEVRK